MVRLGGQVLPALTKAIPATEHGATADERITLTLVLNRDDQAGFEEFLKGVDDPASPSFHHYLSPQEVSDRFGPTPQDYAAVLSYLQEHGFQLAEGSVNRLTITVSGTRRLAEKAFGVTIGDYRIGDRPFHANDREPELPVEVRRHVQAIAGLTNLAHPQPHTNAIAWAVCSVWGGLIGGVISRDQNETLAAFMKRQYDECIKAVEACIGNFHTANGADAKMVCNQFLPKPPHSSQTLAAASSPGPPMPWKDVTGAGQKVGLVQFDTFMMGDVGDYLELLGMPSTLIANVSQVHVNGGAPAGPNQSEVLLDVDTVLVIAPGAQVVVYDAPFTGAGTSFQAIFNKMIDDGVTVISNSWTYCEDQTTLADVQSIDAILASAAASGISVFNASGDTGGTCLDGATGVIGVPADSPHATAVGGSSLTVGPAATYQSEIWWDGAAETPPTGQGGFGVSRFFTVPDYQNALTTSPMRSVPDVVIDSDPAHGVMICQANNGGCPAPFRYGGTSGAAPAWAAFAALLNQAQGQNLGHLNPLIYPLANGSAFHSATDLGSDFTHVGLGSPNLDALHLALTAMMPGPPSPEVSQVRLLDSEVSADGSSTTEVVVRLRDADGNSVSGKTVSLAASSGSHAVISPPSGVSTVANGGVVFTVSDPTIEEVTFTAHDDTDNVALLQTAALRFVAPPATSGGISAFPSTAPANGSSAATVTVTLQDVHANGTPNKLVVLSQGSGRSHITGPTPSLTDTNGQVMFAVTDTFTESVTYTATDATDGGLEIPATATVTFTNGVGSGCSVGQQSPAAGWSVTSPATGFTLSGNCVGASGTAWDPNGNLYVMDYGDGNLYKFPPAGGAANAGTRVTTTPLGLATCPHGLAFSKDAQHLYLARQFCGNGGDVVEISSVDGHIIRTVGTGIPCATGIATDPLSGDLFVTTPCPPGGGTDNIYRISNPESQSPGVSVYSSPGHALGLNFTPDGTLWTEAYRFADNTRFITKITGTNSQSPGTFTDLTSALPFAGGVLPVLNPDDPGNPPFLFVTNGGGSGGVARVDLTQDPPAVATITTGGSGLIFVNAGPDGCAYVSNGDRIDRITAADGSCNFAPSAAAPALVLAPTSVSPNPAQGTQTTFTVTLVNVSAPADRPVFFVVGGANAQVKLAHLDAAGTASISYTGVFSGTDTISASATVGSTTLVSTTATVQWVAGKHSSFLTLNSSPAGALAGTPLALRASLTDSSVSPPAAVAGATLTFVVAGQICEATTASDGSASCTVTLPNQGAFTLNANFAGDEQFLSAAASVQFNVTGGTSQVCAGDCDGSRSVSGDELIILANIALGNRGLSACPHGVPSGQQADIALIINAVNNAFNGCPP